MLKVADVFGLAMLAWDMSAEGDFWFIVLRE